MSIKCGNWLAALYCGSFRTTYYICADSRVYDEDTQVSIPLYCTMVAAKMSRRQRWAHSACKQNAMQLAIHIRKYITTNNVIGSFLSFPCCLHWVNSLLSSTHLGLQHSLLSLNGLYIPRPWAIMSASIGKIKNRIRIIFLYDYIGYFKTDQFPVTSYSSNLGILLLALGQPLYSSHKNYMGTFW